MILSELRIHHLRNISFAQLKLNARFNFICGPNGSGKTSVLEALYLLSCGHSFRSREISPIIAHHEQALTVFAKSFDQETISIKKSCSGPTQVKLNNLFCSSASQLAYALPCQIIYSDIFQIIDAGPSIRRNLLDWGLFHVKHNYFSVWKEYYKVLKHRNALLKQHSPYAHFVPWDKQLSQLANQLHMLREDYFTQWEIEFTKVLIQLSDIECTLKYFKGWDKKNSGNDFEHILAHGFEMDRQKLYTQHGAHQADIIIETHNSKAKRILSRGQQKIILISLKLAQANLLNQDCLYLIDDLPAELDVIHQKKLIQYFLNRKGQYVITSTLNMDYLISEINNESKHCYEINDGLLHHFHEYVSRETI
jgi:DNA replication and repair protein RecF